MSKALSLPSPLLRGVKNPIILATIFCALVIYMRIVPLREANPYQGAIEKEELTFVEGKIASNPVRTAGGAYYTASLSVTLVGCAACKKDIRSSASGVVPLRIPAPLVEAVYPGKLYSLSNSGTVLVESGEILLFKGTWSSKYGCFMVSEAQYKGHGKGILGAVSHFRAMCRLIFKRLMYSWGEAGGLVLSLLSGSREYTERGVSEAFKAAGLSHILALSGMHLSFFAGITGRAGKSFLGKRWLFLAEFFGIVFFVWFAGLSPSLFRALLCSLLTLLAGVFFCKSVQMLHVLSVSFLLHAVMRPSDIFSVAFLLSYGALLGILLFSTLITKMLSPVIPYRLASALAASIGAQVVTTPITIAIFGSCMPVGIIASVVVSPLISIFLSLSLVGIVLSLCFPFLSPTFGFAICALYKVIRFLVSLFALVPPVTF